RNSSTGSHQPSQLRRAGMRWDKHNQTEESHLMSDYIPKDPLDPRNDRYGNTRSEPVDDGGKGPYILLGLLVAIGPNGGALYFDGAPKNGEVAMAPNRPAIERTVPAPAP